jgi:hypothetical protein
MNKSSLLAAAAALAVSSAFAHAQDFRVLPYLTNPSTDGMQFTWFTEADVSATFTVSGGDLTAPVSTPVGGALQPNATYTQAERDQAINLGYPLLGDDNFKYVQNLSGLSPNTRYDYQVSLAGGGTFDGTFKTAPTAADWDTVRFIAMSDSETEPRGNTNRRDWAPGVQAPTSVGRPANIPVDGSGRALYPLTETDGYANNMAIVNSRNPDFVVMPGDLVQGGGYQLGWDEFWRHNAGSYDTSFTNKPLLPALGNWENFGAINGGYGNPDDRTPVALARQRYKTYFDLPSNGTPAHQDNYYRQDYGPVTIITLDSSNGTPDQERRDPNADNTDTQSNYTAQQYADSVAAADPSLGLIDDLSDFNPGSVQYQWAQQQIAEARAAGQIVFVQWHNVAYSSGVHGFEMSHPQSSGQGGTPLRQYAPLFDDLGVAAVLSGHSEMFERSVVDPNGDGVGVQFYDVGVAGDGMRGRVLDQITGEIGGQNPFSVWTADGDSEELWVDNGDGTFTLVDGGKHYGHLEVEINATGGIGFGEIILTPVYSFPTATVSADGQWVVGDTTERRVYGDVITLALNADGSIVPEPTTAGLAVTAAGLLLRRRSRR